MVNKGFHDLYESWMDLMGTILETVEPYLLPAIDRLAAGLDWVNGRLKK